MKGRYIFVVTAIISLFFCHSAYAENGYIVKLRNNPSAYSTAALFDAENTYDMEKLHESLYYIGDAQTLDELLRHDQVEYYEEDQIVYLFDSGSDAEYNDTFFNRQWYWNTINASWLRKITNGEKSVRIGVIDSGICYEHPDFAGSIIERGYNYAAGINDAEDAEDATAEYFHGVMTTGVICATANNNEGIAGIADGVTIVPLKCFSGKKTSLSYIIPAIYAAADTFDCDFINMSFGLANNTQVLKEAIDYVESKGIITVAAVGNDGTDAIYYPAGYDNVIGVGAVEQLGSTLTTASYSQKNESVYITAPGTAIISTSYIDDINSGRTYNYRTSDGTSFAAPIVTAFLALAKSVYPDLTLSDAFEILKKSAVDFGIEGYDTIYGWGVMDMEKGIRYLIDEKNISFSTPAPTAAPTLIPTATPTLIPIATPTVTPTLIPTATPTVIPTATPTVTPTLIPTATPTLSPTAMPTLIPTATPTLIPTATPMLIPTATPTVTPTLIPTATPTLIPTATPTAIPTLGPTVTPTETAIPTSKPAPSASATPDVSSDKGNLTLHITENTEANTITLNLTDDNADSDGIMIIALYDENGAIIDIKLCKIAIAMGEDKDYNIKSYKYKVMLWNDFENMTPLEHMVVKNINPD